MALNICIGLWLLKAVPPISIILLLYFFNKFFLEQARVYPTAITIILFFTILTGSLYLDNYLSTEYECRKIDQHKQKVINFTNKEYEYSAYDWLKDQCNGYPRFHTTTTDENYTIVKNRKITYLPEDTIEALECYPTEGNNIIVWGNCDVVHAHHKVFPKTWYTCNP